MKNLNKNEKIAVVVAVFVVGFFFIFGGMVVSLFNSNTNNISMASQVEKNDVVVGGGEVAEVGKRVVVHYTGRFQDGTIFDSSVERGEPFQFVLGMDSVIQGWHDGIVGMRVGGRRILTIPPEFGYGMSDYGPIPGGSTLIFEIELLRVE